MSVFHVNSDDDFRDFRDVEDDDAEALCTASDFFFKNDANDDGQLNIVQALQCSNALELPSSKQKSFTEIRALTDMRSLCSLKRLTSRGWGGGGIPMYLVIEIIFALKSMS